MLRTARQLCPTDLQHQSRTFAVKAIHSSFPASLAYYSPQHKSRLFDYSEADIHPDDLDDEGVVVAEDGLVYPSVQSDVSNGAVMLPNTFTMQECVRRYFDEFLDRVEDGEDMETPQIYTIPKGTEIPSHLILINDHISRFSLQPSYGMTLQELNEALDAFFDKHAVKETVADWLDKNHFKSAVADYAESVWKAK
ncbi:hypothetical protein B0T24DRAFT_293553 [Lasiosphaeria ovina]|uniref:Tse2 ADP-ribosyltransferase toxin domain-containing protein n=1 Tax=Lasiosphaeria ovina TaxID=92902 RepID=A0AAE0N883_9PEZI|nr:hypothetical protein B0T24DRAFT_293553 [Lasiosphaeria ovina]